MSEMLFQGRVMEIQHRIETQPDPNHPVAVLQVDIVTVDAEAVMGNSSAACELVGGPTTTWPQLGENFAIKRAQDGTLSVAWGVGSAPAVHADVEVHGISLRQSMDATRLTSLGRDGPDVAECPEWLRKEAERAAESIGVKLAWEEATLCIITGRGTIRKHLDLPGMIEPEVGWQKLLMQLGLLG